MTNTFSRREFLKLLSLIPLSYFGKNPKKPLYFSDKSNTQNVLIILFDTLSANHISLHGYPRNTMPNLARLTEKATVYHNHYTAAPFTTPATASILTGMYPWAHRAFKHFDPIFDADLLTRNNIFTLFDNPQYHRIAYTHNPLVDVFLHQFSNYLDEHKPRQDHFLENDLVISNLLRKDFPTAALARSRVLEKEDLTNYSIFVSGLYRSIVDGNKQKLIASLSDQYPRGLPGVGNLYFLLEHAIDWMQEKIPHLPQPFLGYFHLWPPHSPYNPQHEYINLFKDDWEPIDKPEHPIFAEATKSTILKTRRNYDEFIRFVDDEFARLYDTLEKSGILENTWLIFTSDHGEMFERGVTGHGDGVLYEPLIRIPLLIFQPGQQSRVDVQTPTNSVDLLPTLLHLTDHNIPDTLEGEILPPFNPEIPDPERSHYSLRVWTTNPIFAPITQGTIALIKGNYKLIHYLGFPDFSNAKPYYELFDVKNDPEEINNLIISNNSIVSDLKNELHNKLNEVNTPFQ